MFAKRTVGVILFTLLSVLTSCAGNSGKDGTADFNAVKATIDSLSQVMVVAASAKDTAVVSSLYADDVELLPAGAPRATGAGAVRAMLARMSSEPGFEMKMDSKKTIISPDGNLVVDLGQYEMKARPDSGQAAAPAPTPTVGKYVTVFKRTSEGWKIVAETFNSDQPAPGQ